MSSEEDGFDARPLYLRQMLESIETIDQFIGSNDFESYQGDRMLRAAVERYLLILTEASIRLGPAVEFLCPGIDPRRLRNMGNFLRHKYDHIDDQIVWDTVKNDLPGLKLLVSSALAAFGKPQSGRSPA